VPHLKYIEDRLGAYALNAVVPDFALQAFEAQA